MTLSARLQEMAPATCQQEKAPEPLQMYTLAKEAQLTVSERYRERCIPQALQHAPPATMYDKETEPGYPLDPRLGSGLA